MHHAILIITASLLFVCIIALGVFLLWAHDITAIGSLLMGALSHEGGFLNGH